MSSAVTRAGIAYASVNEAGRCGTSITIGSWYRTQN